MRICAVTRKTSKHTFCSVSQKCSTKFSKQPSVTVERRTVGGTGGLGSGIVLSSLVSKGTECFLADLEYAYHLEVLMQPAK